MGVNWHEVFKARCRSKRGELLSVEDQALCAAAWKEDAERYAVMGKDVHDATLPFGAKRLP